ncbi:MAG: hypothetical protein KR126chlam1_00376 [Chlamydiae bacterium]|nr:hypothetical protein [Chlamydiota bacterium]
MIRLIRFSILLVILFATARFCQKQTDHFTILGISSNREYNPQFATRSLSIQEGLELDKALSQPYTYFGCGGQAFAFFSEDGEYVIKFFKQRLFRRSFLLNTLPLPKILHRYREKRNWKRDDKLERDFFSYKTAFDELQEETRVLYSHLNPTYHLKKKLEIIDRLGIHHFLNLDQFDFIVQRRAVRVYDHIEALMQNQKEKEAKEAIRRVFHLISTRAKKGYRDRDPNVRTNCGFIGDQAIKIDVGRFVISPEMASPEGHDEEILRITAPFKEWVNTHYPQLIPSYEEGLEESLIQ